MNHGVTTVAAVCLPAVGSCEGWVSTALSTVAIGTLAATSMNS